MANSEVSRLKFNDTTYEIADELARESVGTALAEVASVEAKADAYNTALSGRITNLENSSGAVLVAKTRTAMTDTNKIYVYTGTTTTASGVTYTKGHWYYHNGSKWTDGGEYNQNLDAIDATLTQSNKGADAKVTGDRLTAAETDISTLRGTIANEYAIQTYAVGDYCYHSGLLYRCNTEISVGEEWTSSHWTAVDVMPELNNLKNDMKSSFSIEFKEKGGDVGPSNLTIGTINGNTGAFTSSTTRVRLDRIHLSNRNYFVCMDDDTYQFGLYGYSSGSGTPQNSYVGIIRTITRGSVPCYVDVDMYSYVVAVFKKPDNSTMTEQDIIAINSKFHVRYSADISLKDVGYPADAYTTGNAIRNLYEEVNLPISLNGILLNKSASTVGGVTDSTYISTTDTINISVRKAVKCTSDQFKISVYVYGPNPSTEYLTRSLRYTSETIYYIPENARHIRINFKKNNLEPFTEEDKQSMIDSLVFYKLKSTEGSKNYNCYSTENNYGWSHFPTVSSVYEKYDELLTEYPKYVSKNPYTVGTMTFYEYVFTRGNYNTSGRRSVDSEISLPKILISSGIHGYEQGGVVSLLDFCIDLCNYNSSLANIANQFEFHILPILNPWGYDNNTRKNSNGVDLNRNFDANWTYNSDISSDNYAGESAADQIETQIAQNWVEANSDAKLYIDVHNSLYAWELCCLLGGVGRPQAIKDSFLRYTRNAIPYLTNVRGVNLEQYYSGNMYDTIFSYTGGGSASSGGLSKAYGEKLGIPSYTMELSWRINSNTTTKNAFCCTVGCESLGNAVIGLCNYLYSENQ